MTEQEIMQQAKMDMDKLGLPVREQQGQNGPYQEVYDSKEAQQFALDHLMEILREEK